jgi:hypothetical protein
MGKIPLSILCLAVLLCTLGSITQAYETNQHDLYWLSSGGDGMRNPCEADDPGDSLSLEELQEVMANAMQARWAEFTATEDEFREIIQKEMQRWHTLGASVDP